jgi:hypothetical protein
MRKIGIGVAILAVLAMVGAFVTEQSFASRAVLAQRVERDETAELFGDAGTPIGSPQRLIIDDEGAFLPGEGEGGARLVSEKYLTEKGIYPLQLKTVSLISGIAKWGSGAGLLVGLGLVGLGLRRQRSTSVGS